jgi:hypothetical protein
MSTLYETDFYSWAMDQAEALREAARLDLNTPKALDWENLAEEIESLARSDARELKSRCRQLLMHLLKWVHQPDRRSVSWLGSIDHQRMEIGDLLEGSPSLEARLPEIYERAYRDARQLAARQTHLPLTTFPEACPFTIEQTMDPDFPPPDDRPAPRRRK